MIQQFSFKDGGRDVNAKGSFFRYESGSDGSGITDIRLIIDGNDVGTFVPGDSIELPSSARRWEIRTLSPGCAGLVKIGEGRITSAKLFGVVQTVDAGRARSVSGQSFMGSPYMSPAASNYGFVQLFNKVGSGRNVIVNGLWCIASNPVGFQVCSNASAIGSVLLAASSKLIGSPDSQAVELRGAVNTSNAAFGVGPVFMWGGSTPASFTPVRLAEPIILPPGRGLVVKNTSVNQDLGVTFDWFEEAA